MGECGVGEEGERTKGRVWSGGRGRKKKREGVEWGKREKEQKGGCGVGEEGERKKGRVWSGGRGRTNKREGVHVF